LGIDFTTPLRVESGDERQRIQVPRGSLALKIVPYADVYVDGSRRGLTPMPAIDLYAGRHSVRLVNDRLGRSVVRTVTVRPNSRSMLEVDMTSDL
jgi:serine/threonine-protein kinase